MQLTIRPMAVRQRPKKLAQDAQEASEHNQERLDQLPGEITHQQAIEKIHRDGAAQTQAINAANDSADGSAATAGNNLNSSNRPAGLNEKDPCIDQLRTLLATINANQQAMLALMNSFVDSQGVIAQRIDSLNSKYTLVQRQIYELQLTGNK